MGVLIADLLLLLAAAILLAGRQYLPTLLMVLMAIALGAVVVRRFIGSR